MSNNYSNIIIYSIAKPVVKFLQVMRALIWRGNFKKHNKAPGHFKCHNYKLFHWTASTILTWRFSIFLLCSKFTKSYEGTKNTEFWSRNQLKLYSRLKPVHGMKYQITYWFFMIKIFFWIFASQFINCANNIINLLCSYVTSL